MKAPGELNTSFNIKNINNIDARLKNNKAVNV